MGISESILNAESAPDWSAISRDVKCPLCGYNLRGLVAPTCPECGFHFEWDRVFNPKKYLHPFLFEHHPEKNIISFLQTQTRRFRGGFWKSIDPSHPLSVRRLQVYWAIGAAIYVIPVGLIAAMLVQELLIYRYPPSSTAAAIIEVIQGREFRTAAAFCFLCAVFPLVNFLTLLVFFQSMRRAKVRPGHVLRCTVYSGDIVFWFGLFLAFFTLVALLGGIRPQAVGDYLTVGAIVVYVISVRRLELAYRQYLNFPAAILTIFVSQIIVCLILITALLYVLEY